MTHFGITDDSIIDLDDVYDPVEHALRVTFTSAELVIDCLNDSIAIGDSITGEKAQVVDGRLLTDTTGVLSGEVTTKPATDFLPQTVSVSNIVQSIAFTGLTVHSIAIKALDENPGYIRIGKTDVLSSTTKFYLLSPGESLNISLTAGTVLVYHVIEPSSPIGTYRITTMATN